MEGEQIPRATMSNFIKKRLKYKVSSEFIDTLLGLSKQFIFKVTDKANELCEAEGKKTINSSHLYESLSGLNIEYQIDPLKQIQSALKEENKRKSEIKQQMQERSEQIRKKNSENQQNISGLGGIQIKTVFEKLDEKEESEQNYDIEEIEDDDVEEGDEK